MKYCKICNLWRKCWKNNHGLILSVGGLVSFSYLNSCSSKVCNLWRKCWKNNRGLILSVGGLIFSVGLAVLVSFSYLNSCSSNCSSKNESYKCLPKYIDIEDKDPTKTALGLAGAVLVITNMGFVITRIRRTDTQIEQQKQQLQKADRQIEESKNNNFLAALHQGINMLYSDNINMQMGGIEHLHSLAEIADKEKKLERVERVLEIFCAFVRKVKREEIDKEATGNEKQRIEKRNSEIREIKKEILLNKVGYATAHLGYCSEDSIYCELDKNLEGADLRDVKLYGAVYNELRHVNPNQHNLEAHETKFLHLRHANLMGANLSGADLSCAVLCDVDLTYATLNHTILCGANLTDTGCSAADFSGADLRGACLKGITVVSRNIHRAAFPYALVCDEDRYRKMFQDLKIPESSMSQMIWVWPKSIVVLYLGRSPEHKKRAANKAT